MPNVTAPTRNDQNGQSSTYFLDSVSTTSTTYTYPAQQDALTVTNKGNFPITLTVNGTAYTIQGGSVQTVPQLFTSFTIVATGQVAFDAMAISETTNTANVQLTGSILKKTQVGADINFAFANNAAANTQVTSTITSPSVSDYEYELIVYNPSTVTDVTVKLFQPESTLGGGTRDALVTTFSIPKSQAITGTTINAYAKFVQRVFNGADLKLVVSNDTILGASDGFTATARIREVG